MKKLLFIILIALCLLLPLASYAQGGFVGGLTETAGKTALDRTLSPQLLAAAIIKTLLSIVGLVFVVLIIWGGATYMLSQGSDDKIKSAKIIIRNSVVGLFIVIAGYSITYFIASQLESPGNIKPAFNAACETSGDSNYYSLNCCEYRFQALGFTDNACCSQTSFCNNHATGCVGTCQ